MDEIAILGAGVIGLTSALALAKMGYAVTVIDTADGPAIGGASFGNGAQLSFAYTDAFASPALLRKLPSYLLALDPAVRIRPAMTYEFLHWACSFLANASKQKFERNTLELLELALDSRQRLSGVSGQLNFHHIRTGKLTLYASRNALREAEATAMLKGSAGLQQVILSPHEALELEPALKGYAHPFAGALWSPQDEAGDCNSFCQGLRRVLEEEHNVRFRFGTTIHHLTTDRGKLASLRTSAGEISCTRAVICLGISSREIAASAGVRLPIWPMQGYSMTIPALPGAPRVSVTDSARKMVLCPLNGRLRIAGIADIGPRGRRLDPVRFSSLARTAEQAFPHAGDYRADLNAWTGFRPMTPDNQPIVGATAIHGLFVNCGHGSLGWTLAMGSAGRLADAMSQCKIS